MDAAFVCVCAGSGREGADVRLLEGYYFADCMLLDFSTAPDLSVIQLVVETQYKPEHDSDWRIGQLKIRLSNVEEVQLTLRGGFHADLDYPIGYKGNEIYEFSFETKADGKVTVSVVSDLMLLTATCPQTSVKHILMS